MHNIYTYLPSQLGEPKGQDYKPTPIFIWGGSLEYQISTDNLYNTNAGETVDTLEKEETLAGTHVVCLCNHVRMELNFLEAKELVTSQPK